jgi:hypothetical protein
MKALFMIFIVIGSAALSTIAAAVEECNNCDYVIYDE